MFYNVLQLLSHVMLLKLLLLLIGLLALLWATQTLRLLAARPLEAPAEHFGGELRAGEVKSISVVLPCAEEREHAFWPSL